MRGDQLVGRGARVVHANGTRSICNFHLGVVHQLKKRSWSFVHSTALNTTRSSVAHQEMQHQSHQSLHLRKPWILVRRESIRHRGFEYFFGWFLTVILLIQLRIWLRNEPGCPAQHGHQQWPYQNAANDAYHQAWGRGWGSQLRSWIMGFFLVVVFVAVVFIICKCV